MAEDSISYTETAAQSQLLSGSETMFTGMFITSLRKNTILMYNKGFNNWSGGEKCSFHQQPSQMSNAEGECSSVYLE